MVKQQILNLKIKKFKKFYKKITNYQNKLIIWSKEKKNQSQN